MSSSIEAANRQVAEHQEWRDLMVKNLYQANLLEQPHGSHYSEHEQEEAKEVPVLPHKKTGRPLLIWEELDRQVQEYIRYYR